MDVTETIKDWVSDPGEDELIIDNIFFFKQLTAFSPSSCLLVFREQSGPKAGRPLPLLHLHPVHKQHRSQQERRAGGSFCRFVFSLNVT